MIRISMSPKIFRIYFWEKNDKMIAWKPCNAKSGEPVGRRVLKIAPIDFTALKKGYTDFHVHITIFVEIN